MSLGLVSTFKINNNRFVKAGYFCSREVNVKEYWSPACRMYAVKKNRLWFNYSLYSWCKAERCRLFEQKLFKV